MPITRHFLDSRRPGLLAAVDFLFEQYKEGNTLNLERVIVVVPGRRAGRRLLELLLERARDQQLTSIPPQIVTIGTFPEKLYEARRPFANDSTQLLAWVAALRESEPTILEEIFPDAPEHDDSTGWLPFASVLWSLHRELAADGLDFGDVARLGLGLEGFSEQPRWRALQRIQQAYLVVLDELELWDIQTARLYAIEQQECRTDLDVVLLGTVDMNRALRKLLDLVGERVTALIHAPEDWAERFDSHGCLNPKAWENSTIPLRDDQVCMADDPADQAVRVLRQIAVYNGRYGVDEIAIGVPDEAVVPHLQSEFEKFGVSARWPVGRQLSQSAPYRLLTALGRYLTARRSDEWSALLRHPDIHDWLRRRQVDGDWLSELDAYRAKYLATTLRREQLVRHTEYRNLARAHEEIETLLKNLPSDELREPADWADPLAGILRQVYRDDVRHRDDTMDQITIKACGQVADGLGQLRQLPARVVPAMRVCDAITVLLEILAGGTIAAPVRPEALEMLGWLELPLDDAPALIVTSVNDGIVPTCRIGDLFLPDALREHLGIEDNLRRYARDAYALEILLRTREDLLLVVGRRDVEGNPLLPSRLLLATDQEQIAHRLLNLYGSADDPQPRLIGSAFQTERNESDFDVPHPKPLSEPIESMTVTGFSSFLRCPYRFYLAHVLKLQRVDDRAEELDALQFGSLIHDALNAWGKSDVRDSLKADKIRERLFDALNDEQKRWPEGSLPAAFRVQLRQMQARLSAFAAWQANWAGEGWRVVHTEIDAVEGHAKFPVDGQAMKLRGRIDRIDQHNDGRWAIFDYKSSTKANRPETDHRQGAEWVNLQLPLYRHIAATLDVTGDVSLGYIALPKDPKKAGGLIAKWTQDDLMAADDVARWVIREIRDENFWPPKPTPKFAEDYASICMDHVFEQPQYVATQQPGAE
ncbi:MAG: PD-(D/E)XK nuclease family protein [Pirellulales bacterium]